MGKCLSLSFVLLLAATFQADGQVPELAKLPPGTSVLPEDSVSAFRLFAKPEKATREVVDAEGQKFAKAVRVRLIIEEFLTIGMNPTAFASPKRPQWNPSQAFVDVGDYTPRLTVEPGWKLNVRFWAKLDGKADRWATVYWWHKDKRGGDATGRQQGPAISGNKWRQYEITATVPPETAEACVALNYFSPGPGRMWYDDIEVAVDTGRPPMPPAEVTPLQDSRGGLVIALDGLRHRVVFGGLEKPGGVEATLAGHRIACDGTMACVTLDAAAQDKPLASWLLDGKNLRLDDKPLSPARTNKWIPSTQRD
jgi:hypothetical protein